MALRKTLAVAALLAIVAVFALEGFPHHHVNGFDDRECPACQAARQRSRTPRLEALPPSPPDALPLVPTTRSL
jgi:hypothetical protein